MLLPLLLSMAMKCQNNLIAENPYPYADDNTIELLEALRKTGDKEIETELIFRRDDGLLSEAEINELERILMHLGE